MRRLVCAAALAAAMVPGASWAAPAIEWEVMNRFRAVDPVDHDRFIGDYQRLAQTLDQGQMPSDPASKIYRTAWNSKEAQYREGYAHPDHWMVRLTIASERPLGGQAVCTWKIGDSTIDGGCNGTTAKINAQGATASVKISGIEHPLSIVVKPHDRLVVSLGDSFASGEGIPHRQYRRPSALDWGHAAEWWDRRCHRSLFSGPALAAVQHSLEDKHSSVTFLSYACSGALVNRGILGSYAGAESLWDLKAGVLLRGTSEPHFKGEELPPQISALTEALCPPHQFHEETGRCEVALRKPSVLIISIGGNDLQFGPLTTELVAGECDEKCERRIKRSVAENLDLLADSYDRLARKIAERIDPPLVLLTEYPDPTHMNETAFCDNREDPFTSRGFAALGFGITEKESRLAYEQVILPLQTTICSASHKRTNWRFVSGLVEKSKGYCTADTWFNDIPAALRLQHQLSGAMHPNLRGTMGYAAAIKAASSRVAAQSMDCKSLVPGRRIERVASGG